MARDTKQQQRRRRIVRRIVAVLGLAAVVALGVVGWRWQASVPVRAVTVSGAVHADTSAVLDLALWCANLGEDANWSVVCAKGVL